jgi:hypothetical protein
MAIGVRDAIRGERGFHVADAGMHAVDLVAIGLVGAETAEIEEATTS